MVNTMKNAVASVHKNELVGKRLLFSDAKMYIVRLYLFCSDQSAVHEVNLRFEDIKDQNENSALSVRLANNLLGVHYNILENVKDKLDPFIGHLLKATYEKKFQW